MLNLIENIMLMLVVLSSAFVIIVMNPVQSLLWLIVTFGLSSIIFMMLGVEFLSLLIFMMYMGAMAVLFLFVVMMLNIKIVELSSVYFNYFPVSLFIIMFFLLELIISMYFSFKYNLINEYVYIQWLNLFDYKSNVYLFGYLMYTYFSVMLVIMAIMLFVSMIGSMMLIVNWGENINKMKNYYGFYFFKNKKMKFIKK